VSEEELLGLMKVLASKKKVQTLRLHICNFSSDASGFLNIGMHFFVRSFENLVVLDLSFEKYVIMIYRKMEQKSKLQLTRFFHPKISISPRDSGFQIKSPLT